MSTNRLCDASVPHADADHGFLGLRLSICDTGDVGAVGWLNVTHRSSNGHAHLTDVHAVGRRSPVFLTEPYWKNTSCHITMKPTKGTQGINSGFIKSLIIQQHIHLYRFWKWAVVWIIKDDNEYLYLHYRSSVGNLKLDPVIVSFVPPAVPPLWGETPVINGVRLVL